jgi:hypothetical protein
MKAVPDVGLSGGLENGKRLHPKLGWTLHELAQSLGVSVPFLRLEVKRGGTPRTPGGSSRRRGPSLSGRNERLTDGVGSLPFVFPLQHVALAGTPGSRGFMEWI